MISSRKIAIAGAGIGGLAAAALLARQGHEVSVYDQFDTPKPIGCGLILQETGLAILAELGLRERAEQLGAPLYRLYGQAVGSGRTVLDVRYDAIRPGLCGVAIQRPVLFDLVYRAAMEAGARVVPSTRILSAQAVSGYLTTGEGKTLGPFDLVVDALGVRSPLSSRSRSPLAYGALWATLPWKEDLGFEKTALAQRYRQARQMAGVMPSGRGSDAAPETLTYFWSIRADAHAAWKQAPLSDWKREATTLWPETAPLLEQLDRHDQLTFAQYDHRTHGPVVNQRLVHLGDSWHAASPQLGQGANMALLDAFALARAMTVHDDLDRQLRHYASMRSGHVRLFQAMSWLFTPVYQSDSTMLAWLRDWLAAPISKVPPGAKLLAAMVSGGMGSPLKKLGLKPGDQSPPRDLSR
jgi:2-polyprenyl-6-methoxyphenol hydroxylase-like FAD-dependent oxidoreductase